MTSGQIIGLVLILVGLLAFGLSTVAGVLCLVVGLVLVLAGL